MERKSPVGHPNADNLLKCMHAVDREIAYFKECGLKKHVSHLTREKLFFCMIMREIDKIDKKLDLILHELNSDCFSTSDSFCDSDSPSHCHCSSDSPSHSHSHCHSGSDSPSHSHSHCHSGSDSPSHCHSHSHSGSDSPSHSHCHSSSHSHSHHSRPPRPRSVSL